MIKVIKRDGREVEFEQKFITTAIIKAISDSKKNENDYMLNKEDFDFAKEISESVQNNFEKSSNDSKIDIEQIQDLVEHKLMCSKRKDVAKLYIGYRKIRNDKRHEAKDLDKQISELINMDGEYVKANANKDAKVFNTQRDLLAGIISKDYALREILPKDVSEAHIKGEIYWHDADYSPFIPYFNCILIDFKGMLEQGFTIGNADVESPKSIETATALVAQIVANVSSNIYGGTTFNRIDEVLEPYAFKTYEKHFKDADKYVEKDKRGKYAIDKTKKSIYNAMQSLEYEINTLFNSKQNWSFIQ